MPTQPKCHAVPAKFLHDLALCLLPNSLNLANDSICQRVRAALQRRGRHGEPELSRQEAPQRKVVDDTACQRCRYVTRFHDQGSA